jgi:hypothetical protein
MEKEFIPYEQVLALKELGFDESCLAFYDKDLKLIITGVAKLRYAPKLYAPLYQQVFRWFREKYGYYYEIFVDDDKTFGFLISYFLEIGRGDKPIQRKYNTYEEAEFECLKKLIEIVKEKS